MENTSVVATKKNTQTNKKSGTKTKADRTRSQNGLAGVDDHAEH